MSRTGRRIDGSAGRQREVDVRRLAGTGRGRGLGNGHDVGSRWLTVAAAQLNDGQVDLSLAVTDHSDPVGRGIGEVDEPIPHERSAIVDPNAHGLVGLGVSYIDDRAERQGAMRGGQEERIEYLPIRRGPSGELLSVPAGGPMKWL